MRPMYSSVQNNTDYNGDNINCHFFKNSIMSRAYNTCFQYNFLLQIRKLNYSFKINKFTVYRK